MSSTVARTNSPESAGKPALKSMTGFAEARLEHDGWALRVSLRSVNHRFLDLHLRLPEGLEALEPEIRRVLRDRLRRGHVDVNVRVDAAGASAVRINRELADTYLREVQALRQQFPSTAGPDLVALMRLPGVVAASGAAAGALGEEELARLAVQVGACLEQAVERLELMQRTEGAALTTEMRFRLNQITLHAKQVESLAANLRPAYAARLEARLKELLG